MEQNLFFLSSFAYILGILQGAPLIPNCKLIEIQHLLCPLSPIWHNAFSLQNTRTISFVGANESPPLSLDCEKSLR